MKRQLNSFELLEERFMEDSKTEKHSHMPKIVVPIFNETHWELPSYATPLSSGFDVRANIKEQIVLKPGERQLIPTGIYLQLPPLLEAQVRPRSGLANKHGISIVNTPGTVDADYRGQIHANLINLGKEEFVVEPGMKIAQVVIVPIYQVCWEPVASKEDLEETERGTQGHGHSGV